MTALPDDLPPPVRLSPEQAAAYLGVCIRTLANWRSLRRGPTYFTRPCVWYLKSDLDAWIARSRVRR